MPDALDRLKAALADRYTLQRELGRGGMATVYLAEDLKHHRPVALKVLKPEHSTSPRLQIPEYPVHADTARGSWHAHRAAHHDGK
jgi:serine/threonine protein kinase